MHALIMNRSIQILSISLLLMLASAASAQETVTCGIADLDGPSTLDPGTPAVLKVKLTSKVHTSTPEFRWWVSVGTITKGEGTGEITLDTTGLGGQVVTVTVELVGAPVGCQSTVSKTINISPQPPTCGRPFDQYGRITFEDEKARLDNFAIQLSNVPSEYMGLIHVSAGQKTFKGEAKYQLDRARAYLVNVRRIDSSRIITVDCGFYRDLNTKVWVVPRGATFPECDNQIPYSDVKFTKRRP